MLSAGILSKEYPVTDTASTASSSFSDYRSAPERERDAPEALVDFVVRQIVVGVELQCSKTERRAAGLSVLGFPFCTSLSAYSTKRSTLAEQTRLSRGTINGSAVLPVNATM